MTLAGKELNRDKDYILFFNRDNKFSNRHLNVTSYDIFIKGQKLHKLI